MPLHSGDYRVLELSILNVALTDNNPPAAPATCPENFAIVPDPLFPIIDPLGPQIRLSDLGDPIVTVSPEGGMLTIEIDASAFAAAFEQAYICRDAPGDTCNFGGGVSFNAPCLQAFLQNNFTSQSQNFLSFN